MAKKGHHRQRSSSSCSNDTNGERGCAQPHSQPKDTCRGGRRRKAKTHADAGTPQHPACPSGVSSSSVALPDVRAMQCVALKCHHGRHVKVDPNGEMKASSSVIGETEKLELLCHDDGRISFRSCHGKFVAVDKSGGVKADKDSLDDAERFALLCNADGTISLQSCRGYLAAETKCGLRANRAAIGAWEKFLPKDRSRARKSAASGAGTMQAAVVAAAEGEALGQQAMDDVEPPIFDCCCHLQAVLSAEEQYAATHSDRTAVDFRKRCCVRRDLGLEWSFRHFQKEMSYPASFRGCISAWDVTTVRLPVVRGNVGSADEAVVADPIDSFDYDGGPKISSNECDQRCDVSMERIVRSRRVLAEILEVNQDVPEQSEGQRQREPSVRAAFGIPAESAAEADEEVFDRLATLCRMPLTVAVGPISLNFPDAVEDGSSSTTPAPEVMNQYCGLRAAAMAAEFGALPSAKYDASRDPACSRWLAAGGANKEAWIARHGDRRLSEFRIASADYAHRREEAQVSVAERQALLAKEAGVPLIVQLPPQDAAERRMSEILVEKLGGQGCEHPVFLSAFHGRPKCVAALLKHFPNLVVGFSGLLTHSKQRNLLGEVAFDVPMTRFLLESLGPRFPPADVGTARGSFSHPAHVVNVAAGLATVKQLSKEEILHTAFQNAIRFFQLPIVSAGS